MDRAERETAKIPHAINRALERYGLKLTHSDLIDLSIECQRGYGRLKLMPQGRERHLVSFHGRALVVVYAPPGVLDPKHAKPQPNPYGTIITVLPQIAATSRSPGSYQRKRILNMSSPPKKRPKKARKW